MLLTINFATIDEEDFDFLFVWSDCNKMFLFCNIMHNNSPTQIVAVKKITVTVLVNVKMRVS